MPVSLNVGQLAYICAITCTALSAYLVYKLGLTTRDAAQRNAQFRSLQLHFLIPYLAILLAESIQVRFFVFYFETNKYLRTTCNAKHAITVVSLLREFRRA